MCTKNGDNTNKAANILGVVRSITTIIKTAGVIDGKPHHKAGNGSG